MIEQAFHLLFVCAMRRCIQLDDWGCSPTWIARKNARRARLVMEAVQP